METLVIALLALALLMLSLSFTGHQRTTARISAIDRKLDAVMAHLGVPEPQFPEVVAHLDQGNKIQAVKAYREATGADLKTAKEAVEAIARGRGR